MKFKVGVFLDRRGRSGRALLSSYTRYYSPTWQGCCEHTVEAPNGTEAKRIAKQEHREKCLHEGGADVR